MLYLNESTIRKFAGEQNYKLGGELYEKGSIESIEASEDYDDYSKINRYSISGTVNSIHSDADFNVKLNFDDGGNFIKSICSCEDRFFFYRICEHSAALLLKFIREKDAVIKASRQIKTDKLIYQLTAGAMNRQENKMPVLLEVKFFYDSSKISKTPYSVELKTGQNKTYVVKNMKAFLSCINKGIGTIEFGKHFSFDVSRHFFKDEDNEIINLLTEVYEQDNIFQSYDEYGKNKSMLIKGKKVALTEILVVRLLELLKKRTFSMEMDRESYEEVKIIEKDLTLEFELKEEDGRISLNHVSSMPFLLFQKGEYFFYKGMIYKPSEEQIKIYGPLYNYYRERGKNSILFEKDDMEKIASFIIPSVRKISSSLQIDSKLGEKFYEGPLIIQIYLDKQDSGVALNYKFIYGGAPRGFLIKDMDKEMQAAGLLRKYKFVYGNDRFELKDEDTIVEFLNTGVQEFQEIGEVYYTDSFKNMKVYNFSGVRSSVKLNDEDLLELSFKMEGALQSELKDIFKALKEKKKYYRLKKGGFISFEDNQWKDLSRMIDFMGIKDSELSRDKILLPKYNAMYLENSIKENEMFYIEKDINFRQLVNNIRDVKDMEFSPPDNLKKVMRGYQRVGYKWIRTLSACGFGGILADEMGLGKTLQAIACIASLKEESTLNQKPCLVVAPTSLLYNWKNEIEKFSPGMNALVVTGNKQIRELQRKNIEEADVVITSYPLIRRDIEDYRDISFRYCFLDEAQQIKNPNSQNARCVKEIKAEGYFALTGTPVENSLTELWSIFDFIMPGYLLSHNKFSAKYENPIIKNKDLEVLEELNRHIRPFILRRLKKDVIKELPPKIEHNIVVEMTDEQKKVYAAYIQTAKNEMEEEIKSKGLNKSKIKMLALITRLRQICCEPSVFIDNFEGESCKMLALDDLVQSSIEAGHRILLFSQFTAVLKNIGSRFKKNGIDFYYLDGSTKTEERGRMVAEFNEGAKSVFLISLKAGGTGLNLTGADTVIHFDPWWNPAVEEQASDRAHRIGQKKTVEVIRLIARGTIEEKIQRLQERKREIIKDVMDYRSDENHLLSRMSEEEVKGLFTVEN